MDGKKGSLQIDTMKEISVDPPAEIEAGRKDQKNWVPFEYESHTYAVMHIWPFNVMDIKSMPNSDTSAHAVPLGPAKKDLPMQCGGKYKEEPWLVDMGEPNPYIWGFVHGSTQAVRMGNGDYLAFFHAYRGLTEDELMQTYTMGAYTFRAEKNNNSSGSWKNCEGKDAPAEEVRFRLTGISSMPIIPDFPDSNAYKGRYLHDWRLFGYIDYAIFPVSLILEDKYAYVSYAYQNIENFVAKFEIEKLLNSLETVD